MVIAGPRSKASVAAEERMDLDQARKILQEERRNVSRVLEAITTLAVSQDERAPAALAAFFADPDGLALLEQAPDGSPSEDWGADWKLREALNVIASSNAQWAEEFLIERLPAMETFGRLDRPAPAGMDPGRQHGQNILLVRSLRYLSNPTEKTYSFLREALSRIGYYDTYAARALAKIGTERSQPPLWDYILRYWATRKSFGPLFDLQYDRDKPAMFELLVRGYQTFGSQEPLVLEAILSDEMPPYVPRPIDATLPTIPSFESIKERDAARYIAALDKLIAEPGKRPLKPEELKRLQEIRALMVKKDEAYRKRASPKPGPSASPAKPSHISRWPLALGTALAGLLLGFAAAALYLRRRRA